MSQSIYDQRRKHVWVQAVIGALQGGADGPTAVERAEYVAEAYRERYEAGDWQEERDHKAAVEQAREAGERLIRGMAGPQPPPKSAGEA